MKLIITQDAIFVEDGPAMNLQLSVDDARALAFLEALTWGIGRISETTAGITAGRETAAVSAEQANQARRTCTAGLH